MCNVQSAMCAIRDVSWPYCVFNITTFSMQYCNIKCAMCNMCNMEFCWLYCMADQPVRCVMCRVQCVQYGMFLGLTECPISQLLVCNIAILNVKCAICAIWNVSWPYCLAGQPVWCVMCIVQYVQYGMFLGITVWSISQYLVSNIEILSVQCAICAIWNVSWPYCMETIF